MKRYTALALALVFYASVLPPCGNRSAEADLIKGNFSDILIRGPWEDVRAYAPAGTLTDGTVDWTSYIRTAIASGKDIYVPDGVFKFTGTLVVGSPTVNRITIFGNGPNSILSFTPTSSDNAIENLPGGTDHITIKNLTIRQTNGNSVGPCSGVSIDSGGTAWTFDHVHFQGFNSHAIDADSAQYLKVEKCRFLQIENSGLHDALASAINITTFANSVNITNSIFTQNDRHLTIGSAGGSLNITGNTFELAGSTGNTFGITDSIYINNVDGVVFTGNYIEGNKTGSGYAFLHINNSSSSSVEGNYFVGDTGGVTKTDVMVHYENCYAAVNEKNFYSEVLSYFIKATGLVVKTRNNTYIDSGNGLTTYDSIVAMFLPPSLIGTDVAKTVTYALDVATMTGGTFGSVGVDGVVFGDSVRLVAPYDLAGLLVTATVQSGNNVRFSYFNPTGDNVSLSSGTWKLYIDKNY